MGMKGKFEVEVDVNCPSDVLFELFSTMPQNICDISPSNVQGFELHEGEIGKVGSVIDWNYALDGKTYVGKELVEEIDHENKLVRFKVLDGDLLNEFKSLTSVAQVIPKEECSVVKCTLEFEKIHDDDGHYPTKLIDFLIKTNKDIEAYHQQASV